MTTALIYSERFLDHHTAPGHPERPERLRAIVERLRDDGLWDQLAHLPFEPADRRWLERVHSGAYIDRVFDMCVAGREYIDTPDVSVSRDSAEVAQLASGGVITAVEAVHSGRAANAFCAVRPPGHHAERDRAMGFCLFNHIGVAAEYLIAHHGYQRIAIVDFDVHHGNGTQHTFEGRADVLFVSMHEDPVYLYPGTGLAHEAGVGSGAGYTLNVPLEPHAGDEHYRHVVEDQVLPKLRAFEPEFVLVSAGFDALAADPLAHMRLTPPWFEWMTRQLKSFAAGQCDGRLVSVLEGGYDLRALAEAASLHARVLLEPSGPGA